MTIDEIQDKLDRVEKDSTLQNLIAQANARYILYNTSERIENFPKYTIKDDKLNLLAFHYLNLGCRFIENEHIKSGMLPLEKGASILENIHGSPQVVTKRSEEHTSELQSRPHLVCRLLLEKKNKKKKKK